MRNYFFTKSKLDATWNFRIYSEQLNLRDISVMMSVSAFRFP